MANSALFIALCAVLLAIDGSAKPAPASVPEQPCRFTLERDAAPDAEGETWLLTCHRSTALVAQPVVQRKFVKAPALSPVL
jgi:hypothetical protein